MKIFLSPHNDDEALFGAYTILREKPLVIIVTDSYKQLTKGIGTEERRKETIEAMKVLEAPVLFLGTHDATLTERELKDRLQGIQADVIYAPAVYEKGNREHNIIGKVALELYGDRVVKYATYQTDDITLKGDTEIVPTAVEMDLKHIALSKYITQLRCNLPHFQAVFGKSEWYVK